MPQHNDEETKKFEKKQEQFFNSQMLKILALCYAVGAPWFVWATIELFSLRGEVALIKQRQDVIQEIKQDIQTIKIDLQQLKIDVSVLKAKGTP